MSRSLGAIVFVLHLLFPLHCAMAQEGIDGPTNPVIAEASEEGERALQGFKIPAGWKGELFAAEPLVANPVSFFVDHRGRVFVCESFRQNAGVTDNRGHDQAWVDDDLAAQTVDDRLAYHRKHLKDQIAEYTKNDDRVRLLWDTDGDGRADRATVFANRFHGVVDGTGAGVYQHRGRVYFTCIPDLWELRDTDNDGVADVRKSLHSGFGVRVAFRGHDLHGLIVGPDGRIYFSIGDRGYSVATADGRLHDPESGAVFRCEPDGANLEVIATGLRNPQELAFDDFGNLFTGDNNSDSGDKARWVYIVTGSDSGWRMAYQYLPDRGPFNREKLWHPWSAKPSDKLEEKPFPAEQPAYIVPPIANFADGPSGLAFDTGTGLSEHFRGRFLLCDFRGGAANSGIRTFRVKRKGAFFELTDAEQSFWNILATDVQIGPDGGLYVSDWVNGWNGEGKGRIYRFSAPDAQQSAIVSEVRQLLAQGMSDVPVPRLIELLRHADRRVRMEAQFELAERNDLKSLLAAAQDLQSTLGRLHGMWGLGQIARHKADSRAAIAQGIRPFLQDEDSEVRAQAAQLIGDVGDQGAMANLIQLLSDEDWRVRSFAAMALGKLRATPAREAIARLLEENSDRDPIVRHAGIMALTGTASPQQLAAWATHSSRSVRLAAVVALRKLKSPLLRDLLADSDPQIVVEAARAIHDVPLIDALPDLAGLITKPSTDDALLRRVLNASYRLGTASHAQALADFAARNDVPTTMRVEALEMLAQWERPSSRDRVLGMWRPMSGDRSIAFAAAALRSQIDTLRKAPREVWAKAGQAALAVRIPEAAIALRELFDDRTQKAHIRADAVTGLADLKSADAVDVIQIALKDDSPNVRAAARRAWIRIDSNQGIRELERAIHAETTLERQSALAALATTNDAEATRVITTAMEELVAQKVPADTVLDVLGAAASRSTPDLQKLLADYDAHRPADDSLGEYRESLVGGDAANGQRIFFERTELSCVRCHKINGRGGEVGPDLSRIAVDKSREYLLEAITLPNRAIAKGFEAVVIIDVDGKVHAGVLRSENSTEVKIVTAEGQVVSIPVANIDERSPGKSPMPEDLVKKISKRELRDLVEFMATLK